MLAELAAAAHAANSEAIVAIVSDHGFTALTHRINLLIPFVRAGLVRSRRTPSTQAPKLASWKAQPGGTTGANKRPKSLGPLSDRGAVPPRRSLAEMQKALGPYLMANDTSLQGW